MNEPPRTTLPGPTPKTMRRVGLVLAAALVLATVAPTASAGPGAWAAKAGAYQIKVLACHSSVTPNECTPDCGLTLDGAVCVLLTWPRMFYEDSVGDWPL